MTSVHRTSGASPNLKRRKSVPRAELETPKTQTSGAVLANKTDAQASLERIQNFEEAFARIRSATGIEDIEELVRARLSEERCLPTCARFCCPR